jgi:hypothetical protein
MQNQTPAANSQTKFHISPQEAIDFANISHFGKFSEKKKKLKHQRTITTSQLHPAKQTKPAIIAVK